MNANFFNSVVDQQTNIGCPNPPLVQPPLFSGDITADPYAIGPTAAYSDSPWTPTPESSVAYLNGKDCSPKGTCLSVNLNKNQSTFSIDTRYSQDSTTGKPRNLVLNFSQPCASGCPYGPGPVNPFGVNPLPTPGLLSVFLTVPYTQMATCSSTDCPEAEPATARFWFDDPNGNTNLQWRVDWTYVRVLRMNANTWYVLADTCDGSQIATLYRLANNKKNATLSRQGQYLMPFFVSAVK